MKHPNYLLSLFALFALTLLSTPATAQGNQSRPSPHATVNQRIGAKTEVTIDYSRPAVKGRKVWGELVPFGFAPGNKYSKDKPYPWRAGANENTTIEFSTDVLIEGQKIAAGKYSIHMIPAENEPWVVIFNKVNNAWGSYSYDETQDALRIKVTPAKAPHEEFLTFGFTDLTGNGATAFLHWEQLKVPFKVQVP